MECAVDCLVRGKGFKQLPKKAMQGCNEEPELHIFFKKIIW